MKYVLMYGKALAGGLVAGLTSLITALGDNTLSMQEWLTAVLAFVVGTGVVAYAPYRPKDPTPPPGP